MKRDTHSIRVRPDAKGRISLGEFAQDVSFFLIRRLEDGKLILEPFSEVPRQEAWLLENKKALASVKRGIKQSPGGRLRSKGSFKKYLKD